MRDPNQRMGEFLKYVGAQCVALVGRTGNIPESIVIRPSLHSKLCDFYCVEQVRTLSIGDFNLEVGVYNLPGQGDAPTWYTRYESDYGRFFIGGANLIEWFAPGPRYGEWFKQLDARQQAEVAFAHEYAKNFQHGTDGHNRLMLIDLMANLLQAKEY